MSKYTGNEYKVQDRNLGAITSVPGLGTTLGLQYQWGRKDPFSGSLTNDGKRTALYNVRSSDVCVEYNLNYQDPNKDRIPVSVGQAISGPDTCYIRVSSDDPWCETNETMYLWGNPEGTGNPDIFPSSTIKTIYDPCPVGYKVPPADVFKIFLGFYKDRSEYGITCYFDGAGEDDNKLIYLPESYRPFWEAGDLHKIGFYWTSSTLEGKSTSRKSRYAYPLIFQWPSRTDYPYLWGTITNTGSIRCVKE